MKSLKLSLMILLFLSSVAFSQMNMMGGVNDGNEYLLLDLKYPSQNETGLRNYGNNFVDIPVYNNGNQEIAARRSILKSVLFSGVVPGGGEFYNRSFIKGSLFSGIEVLSWILYIKFKNEGNDIDAEFKGFANEHWRENVYLEYFEAYKEANNGAVPHHFTHTLPETKTQQYYEMIGKYEQFLIGWDDVTDYEQISERRLFYMDRRGKSNDYLVRASYIAMFTLINRVVSIIDAAVITKNFNMKIDSEISLNMQNDFPYMGYSINLKW